MTYKAIFFDLDDTLHDLQSYRIRRLHGSLDAVLERYAHLDRETVVRAAIAEHVYNEHLAAFLQRQGVDDEALITATCALHDHEWYEGLELFDDALGALETLRKQYKLGMITNGPDWAQRPKIERFKLADYFDDIVVSGEVGVEKPDPRIFHLACEQLAVQPSEALFVGDSPQFDLRGGASVGMDCVWINSRHLTLPDDLPPPVATISRVSELLAVLGLEKKEN